MLTNAPWDENWYVGGGPALAPIVTKDWDTFGVVTRAYAKIIDDVNKIDLKSLCLAGRQRCRRSVDAVGKHLMRPCVAHFSQPEWAFTNYVLPPPTHLF